MRPPAPDRAAGRVLEPATTVSIVIPVCNRAPLTRDCLEALAGTTTGRFEVIVVDDASTDDTPALLASFGSALTVVRHDQRLGGVRARNAGAARARGAYVVFLDDDTLPRPGWLAALVAVAQATAEIGVVGARLLEPDGTIHHAGLGVTADRAPVPVYRGLPADAPEVCRDRDCEAVSAACLLVPRGLFHELGGFDESGPGFADVDLCCRARAAGRRVRYAAASVLVRRNQGTAPRRDAAPAPGAAARTPPRTRRAALQVLFQARANLFAQPGGDTVVVERLTHALAARGVGVRFAAEPEVPAGTDVVHAINFATPDTTRAFAESAARARVPLVVTTLYEDWPRFLTLAGAAFLFFRQALDPARARPARRLDRGALAGALAAARAQAPAPTADNTATAGLARVLVACSDSERRRLAADYPMARDLRVVPFGADAHAVTAPPPPGAFAAAYGVRDFVLCVGRLEARKNQLMLLEALGDDVRPVVLVAGGFSYSPAYSALCRTFRRRGPTLVVERLPAAMLAAAFREAAVHCLPSWYELPGLVSIEAALHGSRVAASSWGAIEDYLGDTIAYLEPDDPESIRRAIATALALDGAPAAAQARRFTWERCADAMLAIYRELAPAAALGPPGGRAPEPLDTAAILAAAERARAAGDDAQILHEADRAAALGSASEALVLLRAGALARLGRLDEAEQAFIALLASASARHRAETGLGVIAFERGDPHTARDWLERAAAGGDTDAWVALALCHERLGEREHAWQAYARARAADPAHRAALHGLITLADPLARLGELEGHLRDYLERVGEDADVRCALAGCLFAAGRAAESRRAVDELLARAPAHPLATALAAELGASGW